MVMMVRRGLGMGVGVEWGWGGVGGGGGREKEHCGSWYYAVFKICFFSFSVGEGI